MTKITIDKKIEIIGEYINDDVSKYFICKKYGINKTLSRVLVGIYKEHVIDKLLNSPKITGESRITLIKWKQDNRPSISETCIHFAFRSIESLVRWECEYNIYGPKTLVDMHQGAKNMSSKSEKQQIKELEHENLLLRIQNDFLKKTQNLKNSQTKCSQKPSSSSKRNTD